MTTSTNDFASPPRATVAIPTASGVQIEARVYRPGGEGPHPAVHPAELLDRVFTHLRAHVTELHRLEGAGARQEEIEERQALIGQLQGHLAEVVRTTLVSAR
jgi:hypothetical protein